MKNELTQFNDLQFELSALVAPTRVMKVTDAVSSSHAIDAAKQVKSLQKRIEEKRKALVGPLNDRVKEINDYAKGIVAPLAEAEAHLKRELVAFEVEQEKIRQEELRKAEEERRRVEAELQAKHDAEQSAIIDAAEATDLFGAGEDEPSVDEQAAELERRQEEERLKAAQDAKAVAYDIKRANGISGAKKIWKCEAADISQVPKEFLVITLNEKAVLAAARAGVTNISGVRLWQETTIAIGATTYVPALSGGKTKP